MLPNSKTFVKCELTHLVKTQLFNTFNWGYWYWMSEFCSNKVWYSDWSEVNMWWCQRRSQDRSWGHEFKSSSNIYPWMTHYVQEHPVQSWIVKTEWYYTIDDAWCCRMNWRRFPTTATNWIERMIWKRSSLCYSMCAIHVVIL